jgi:hypothetical protein
MRHAFIRMKADPIDLEKIDDPNVTLAVETVDRNLMTEAEICRRLILRDRQHRLKRDLRSQALRQRRVHTSLRTLTNDEINLSHQVEEVRLLMTPTELGQLLKTEVAHKVGTETDQVRIRDINHRRIPDTNPLRIQNPTHDQGHPKIRIVS